MSRNDYYVMAYKLLNYLYNCLKRGRKPDLEYIRHDSKAFPVGEEYFDYLIEHMAADGYIENVIVRYIDDGAIISFSESIRISPKGIDYLEENQKMKKIAKAVRDAAELIP